MSFLLFLERQVYHLPPNKLPSNRADYAELHRVTGRDGVRENLSREQLSEFSDPVWKGSLSRAQDKDGKFMTSIDLRAYAQKRRKVTERKSGRGEGSVIFCAEGCPCLAFARLPDGSEASGVMGNIVCVTRGPDAKKSFLLAGARP